MSNKRYIIIGDVHGCYDELYKLLKKVDFKPGQDQVIFTGDVINRGPNSKACIDLINHYGCLSVLGNHEYFLIKSVEDQEYDWNVYKKMSAEFGSSFNNLIETIKTWPLWLEFENFIVVHAGIDVGKALNKTEPEFLVSVREINKAGQKVAWYENYEGKKTIIFGHWAQLGGIIRKNLIGLDLGCVYGRALRAVIMPSREFVEVAANQIYFTDA